MKLLVEQKERLEAKIKSLKQENQVYKEKRTLFGHYESDDMVGRIDSIEARTYSNAIQANEKIIEDYEHILSDAEIVTHFNNEQIEIGTQFVLEFSDGTREKYTLVETNAGVSTLEGYLTFYSEIGKKIYKKAVGASIQVEASHEEIKIVEIVPKKEIQIACSPVVKQKEKSVPSNQAKPSQQETKKEETKKQEVKKEASTSQEEKHTALKFTYRFPREGVCAAFRNYYKSLQEHGHEEDARKEMLRLDNVTFAQKKYLNDYLGKLMIQKRSLTNHLDEDAYSSQIKKVKDALQKKSILPQTVIETELGKPILLEVTKNKTTDIVEGELIPRCYGDEQHHGFISIRSALGFFAYHAKMGEQMRLTNPSQRVRVAQFGIDRSQILLPLSVNLQKLSPLEEAQTEMRLEQMRKFYPKMTLSQRTLLEQEICKLSAHEESTYQEYLQSLLEQMKKGYLEVQQEKEVEANEEQIGLGSTVLYELSDGKQAIQFQKELIWNAYTTESKEDYLEMSHVLGASLFGKKEQDEIQIPYQGKMRNGRVLQVTNQVPLETTNPHFSNFVYRKK